MSLKQIRMTVALLIALHVAAGLLLNPFNLSVSASPLGQRATLVAIGALIAQPALLALWAALAPQPFLRRWAQALAILALVNLASDFASVQNANPAPGAGELAQPLLWLVPFLVCQLPLWPLRRRYAWRVESPLSSQQSAGAGENQFSIGGLLATVACVAIFLAALRWLHPASGKVEWPLHVLRCTAMGACMAVPGMLVLAVGWMVLAPGFRGVWRWSIAALGVGGVCGAAAAVAAFGSPGEVGELVFVLLGLLLSSVFSLMVIRLCGYRLMRKAQTPPAQQPPDADGSENLPVPRPRLRFASLIATMAVLFLALVALAPGRLALWREIAEQRGWSASGLRAAVVDGQVTQLKAIDGVGLRIDQATIARINGCRQLQRLELWGPAVTDGTLELFESLPCLTRLSLFGAQISDDGLRHLAKHRNLNNLDLRMTEVTDDGLVILERFRNLHTADLGHTRVTAEGLAWLGNARPGLQASAITNDTTLWQVAVFFRTRRTRLSQDGAPPPTNWCVRATGPGVTDVGVSALRGASHIAELDLSQAKVTDAAVSSLITLGGLKRLQLSGTRVTKTGVERLRRSLPECDIMR